MSNKFSPGNFLAGAAFGGLMVVALIAGVNSQLKSTFEWSGTVRTQVVERTAYLRDANTMTYRVFYRGSDMDRPMNDICVLDKVVARLAAVTTPEYLEAAQQHADWLLNRIEQKCMIPVERVELIPNLEKAE